MGNFDKKIAVFIETLVDHGGYNKVLEGLQNTVIIAVLGLLIGSLIGTLIAAVRVMPPCVAMGEAAGVTAALAAKSYMTVKAVNYKDVQAELVKRGAFLDI